MLHYLIHSYDFPGLAHLALDAAMTYADAAADSAHAQHRPSQIFTRLGLWDRSIASNHDSTRSPADYTQRAHLPGHYDEGLHSIDYFSNHRRLRRQHSGRKTDCSLQAAPQSRAPEPDTIPLDDYLAPGARVERQSVL